MNIINIFEPDKVTYSTDLPAILKLHKEGKLTDILPRIYPGRVAVVYDDNRRAVDGSKQLQQDILQTWIRHFEGQGIPIALTEGKNNMGYYLVMWKERRV